MTGYLLGNCHCRTIYGPLLLIKAYFWAFLTHLSKISTGGHFEWNHEFVLIVSLPTFPPWWALCHCDGPPLSNNFALGIEVIQEALNKVKMRAFQWSSQIHSGVHKIHFGVKGLCKSPWLLIAPHHYPFKIPHDSPWLYGTPPFLALFVFVGTWSHLGPL